ncbi:MAG: hypothetical protein IKE53_08320 [Clostridiales bacterium]|nr:hypothetical protein [Clostridiales bacterium]
MKNSVKRCFAAITASFMVFSFAVAARVSAADAPEEVSLYSLQSEHEGYIEIPGDHYTEYQIDPAELGLDNGAAPTYRIISKSAAGYTGNDYNYSAITVSDTGLVTPGFYTWYWLPTGYGYSYPVEGYTKITTDPKTGTAVVRVTAGSEYRDIIFHHYSYGEVYAEEQIDNFLAENATPDMSIYEIAELGARFAASFDYAAGASYADDMIVRGGGDCWGSTDIIVKICERYDIKAWGRNGRKDAYAGSGHRNALVEDSANGVWYEVEAGYSGRPAPRYYEVRTRTSLFSYRMNSDRTTIEVYQYDEETSKLKTTKEISFPDQIDGHTVTSIGRNFISDSMYDCMNIERISIPKTITNIAASAFVDCNKLTDIYYEGTQEEWDQITIGTGNEIIQSATVHCNSVGMHESAQVLASTIALNDRIGVNYFLSLPEEFLNDEGAYAEVNGERCTICSPDSKGRYPVVYSVAAAEMRDDLVLSLHLSDGSVYPLLDKKGVNVTDTGFHYSVATYISDANSSGNANAALIELLKRMADFGKYAQIMFNHNPDLGSLSDISGDVADVTEADLSRYRSVVTQAFQPKITFTGATLALDSATRINFKFQLADGEDINDYSFYVDNNLLTAGSNGDSDLQYDASSGRYVVTIKNIAAAELQIPHSVLVKDSEGRVVAGTYEYSALSYVSMILTREQNNPGSVDSNLLNIAKATYLYNRAAMAYFNITEPQASAASVSVQAANAVVDDTSGDETVITEASVPDEEMIVPEETGEEVVSEEEDSSIETSDMLSEETEEYMSETIDLELVS